jgi:amino acid adenylation domain-containing protein
MSRYDGGTAGGPGVIARLGENEHRALVREFNETAAPYPADKTIVDLFAAQARRTPEAAAISFGERSLTYRELDDLTDRFASCLLAAGAGPRRFVVLRMEHSIEAVCAILGILKSGAAYVPLDPAIPKQRLSFVVRDIADGMSGTVPVVVTQPHLAADVSTDLARVVAVDGTFVHVASCEPIEVPSAPVDDPAYVIYTSGSTGAPKGVAVSHRSLVNYIWWANSQYGRGEQLVWPLFTSLAFDLTMTSIFTPLVSGGRIAVYRADPGSQSIVVLKVIKDGVADIVKLTPRHLAMIKDLNLAATRIRRLVVGGEDFKTDLARKISERFGRPVEMFNEYGPTEATVGCLVHRYDSGSDLAASVPLGRPAANAHVFLLDDDRHPVPPGVIGEMYVAGDGLALGYFNRPELTEAAFVTIDDPRVAEGGEHSASPRQRAYKTGDLARWTPDGRLEFLGRADDQVKIGGFRVELGEIEACLVAHPDVREAIVTIVNSASATTETASEPMAKTSVERLVAYYIAPRTLPAAELRAHLAEQLPDSMLPTHFVRVDAFALTPNGKVDRRTLPEPLQQHAVQARGSDEPQSDIERALAAMWCQLLHVERIGLHDEFFELGGHSLLAMRAVSKMRDTFGVDVPLEVMFAKATIAAVAATLVEAKARALPHATSPNAARTIPRQARRLVGVPTA